MSIAFRHMAVALAAALAVAAAGLGTPGVAARADTVSFCVQAINYNRCLNDWNDRGPGNIIRLYPINNSNEDFIEQSVPGRCGGYRYVTHDCPFSNRYFDHYYYGWPIVQLRYGSSNLCVATGFASHGTAHLAVIGTCNNIRTGRGGSDGTLFVDHNGYMISVYWTNREQYGDNAACMEPENGAGSNSFTYLDLPTGDRCALWSQD